MGKEFVSCSFLLLLLLLIMRAHGNAAGKMEDAGGVIHTGNNVLRLPSENSAQRTGDAEHYVSDVKHGHGHGHASSHMGAGMTDMDDPEAMVVFRINDLKVGNRIPVYFPKIDVASKSFHFLPREEADSIPFSSEALPYLLQFFSISQDSPQAKSMKESLKLCELKQKGQTSFCATSLESLLDSIRSILGSDSQVEIVKTNHIITKSSPSSSLVQNYTVLEEPKEIAAPKMISCHSQAYPYAVYYCHAQDSETKVFKVSLGGDNGDQVVAASVCHMDTSGWNPNHAFLRMLGVAPGTSETCHFFPADHLILVPTAHPSFAY